MNKILLKLLGQVGWIKRQSLKLGGYLGTIISGYLIGKIAMAQEAGLITDEHVATLTQGVGLLEVGITTGLVILAEVAASYFAKGRKE